MKIVYIKDKNRYILDNEHMVKEEEALQIVLSHHSKEGAGIDLSKAKQELETAKLLGITFNQYKSKPSLKTLISFIFDDIPGLNFKWYSSPEGTTLLFRKLDNGSGNELIKLNNCDYEHFKNSLKSTKAEFTNLLHFYRTCSELKSAKGSPSLDEFMKAVYLELLQRTEHQLDTFPVLLTDDPNEPCFKYFDASFLKKGPTPAWNEFLERLDYPEVFLAWVWSIFDPINYGRQVLWLQGNGHDGKSTVLDAISEIYGRKYIASLTQDSTSSQFFFSQVYGKRFVAYGNNTNQRLISIGKIQSLTGNDAVPIEFKGEASFTHNVFARLLVCSNDSPAIDFEKSNESSRIIRLFIKRNKTDYSGDPTWKDKLIKEAPQFLYRCKQEYAKLFPKRTNMDLRAVPQLWETMLLECGSEESSVVDEFYKYELNVTGKAEQYLEKAQLKTELAKFISEKNVDPKKINFMLQDIKQRFTKAGVYSSKLELMGKQVNVYKGVELKK